MLKIRLQRLGRKNDPHFKLIVAPQILKPKTHLLLEELGYYDPRSGKGEFRGVRIKYWLKVGAKASPTVFNLLVSQGILEGKKLNVLPRKSPTSKKKDLKVQGKK